MGAIGHITTSASVATPPGYCVDHGPVVEQVSGLIRLYRDGHVERPPVMREVPPTWASNPHVTTRDVTINNTTGVWARLFVPRSHHHHHHHHHHLLLPLLVYFHGGGFCVGSAAWIGYHEFLVKLSLLTNAIIMSVNYRLAPEHRLPAAYEDGLAAVKWARQSSDLNYNPNRLYLSGDSAGANIAFNVATRLGSTSTSYLNGLILIQPFFSGEKRTQSELYSVQPPRSALSLATSDSYWRLALPPGADRDHPFANPLGQRSPKLEELRQLPPVMVCISELDILKDRDLDFCKKLRRGGKRIVCQVYGGVGHAFQVLGNYNLSEVRTQEMLGNIKGFINNHG